MLGRPRIARSVFSKAGPAPVDSIFGIQSQYRQCALSPKASLTVGTLWGEDGHFFSFPSVLKARALVSQVDSEYLPHGKAEYVAEAHKLLFGENPPGEAIQSVGGTGAIFLAASMYKKYVDGVAVLGVPAWPNYLQIFDGLGLKAVTYPHLDSNYRFNVAGMVQAIREAPRKSLLVLQQVGHNPTGADLSLDEWRLAFAEAAKQDHVLLFDIAYVGYVNGSVPSDTVAVREFARSGRPAFVSLSFSKCMALYGERIGLLTVLGDKSGNLAAQAAWRGLNFYSCPPRTGADIVTRVLEDARLKAQWERELSEMQKYLVRVRGQFVDGVERVSGIDWTHVRAQKGFFGWTGLKADQIKWLHSQGVFMPLSGRVTIPAVNPGNYDFVVGKIAQALKR